MIRKTMQRTCGELSFPQFLDSGKPLKPNPAQEKHCFPAFAFPKGRGNRRLMVLLMKNFDQGGPYLE